MAQILADFNPPGKWRSGISIFAKGEQIETIIDGIKRTALPIAYHRDLEGGVGVLYLDSKGLAGKLWGLGSRCNLIQPYRAMKLVEQMKGIKEGTLSHCFSAASRDIRPSGTDEMNALEIESIIGKEKRLEVFSLVPSNLDDILLWFRKRDILLTDFELKEELAAGTLKMTPVIQRILDDGEWGERDKSVLYAHPKEKGNEFMVPSKRILFASEDPWRLCEDHQEFVPADKKLHKKLGMNDGEKVLFFAGYTGEWAHDLARNVDVYYTDCSRVAYYRARKWYGFPPFLGGRIKHFAVAEGLRWPLKMNYDWIFSFEPKPIFEKSLPLVMLRSITYSHGLIMAFLALPEREEHVKSFREREASVFERLYHTTTSISRPGIAGKLYEYAESGLFSSYQMKGKNKFSQGHHVVHVNAPVNGEDIRKARIDLQLWALASDKAEIKSSEIIKSPKLRGFDVTEKEVTESLERIEFFSRNLMRPSILKTVKVTA